MSDTPINIGFGNMVMAERVISIVSSDSAPTKRLIQEARERKMLIDVTNGRKTRSIILSDSDHVLLSAIQPETVAQRVSNQQDQEESTS
ncbi:MULTISPECIES: DUF370 domain-containing protein [Marinococcus]|jgi:regulator of extracellular matrix RemA (YlzA/DUF370 family)|uniref:Putative regulatory protein SAMN05421781_0665 n=1 Tax=Marinococcus luteus TaxID=1122204 RepID=A0A1H2RAL7_9BACI|nr:MULTISPECIES: DUF370 domain-containing protein [Marinococcus]MDX6152964.1 DUF370 domain-containing protein [Marinococcus sp. PL1-022]MDZ5782275.1 DUF370 domain-containing protein [Marinococcus luteus]SDW16248.1 hypothetical protein SAMN05421781_0665 [Marinococcus luteus]